MRRYISNTGGGSAVDFETAILQGFAEDGGLYVPDSLPSISLRQLEEWKGLSYVDLAFEVLSLFMDSSIIAERELKMLLETAYADFPKEDAIPIYEMKSRANVFIMELFHGPTLSFKDVGLAFLVNLVDFFLERKNEYLNLLVATTGDTGPAAAWFAAGKSCLDAWVLYPKNMITKEQELQMTTLPHANVHPVGVSGCSDGADDLDAVIAQLYRDEKFKNKLKLSSVNSINWGRIMMQTVHYFYAYLKVVDHTGEKINVSVPSGAFGNLCAGAIARIMGLPIEKFVVANNKNACLHRLFSKGNFLRKEIIETASSAIDILIPLNFWRYLHVATKGEKTEKIKNWIHEFNKTGSVLFDTETFVTYSDGFLSYSSSDEETLSRIKEIYTKEGYLLDPHAAVALSAADALQEELSSQKMICLATAHPAKFPSAIKKALGVMQLPKSAKHPSIEKAKRQCEKVYLCKHENMPEALSEMMESNWKLNRGTKAK